MALASELLGVVPQALQICNGVVSVRSQPDRTITLGEVARHARLAGIPLSYSHIYAPENATTYAGAAHAAAVEMDVETGVVTVEQYVVVHDFGSIVDLAMVHAQLHGGVVLGLGQALREAIAYDRAGRLITNSFVNYAPPCADEVMQFVVKEHSCPSRNNPEGIKGVGENGTMGALPAIIAKAAIFCVPLWVGFGATLRILQTPVYGWSVAESRRPENGCSFSNHDLWQRAG